MEDATRAYLALALAPGVGPRKIKALIERFGDAERVLASGVDQLREVDGIGKTLARAIKGAGDSQAPEKELRRARHLGVSVLHLSHPEYPDILRDVFDPPPILYVRGKLPAQLSGGAGEARSFGIVGTRDPSEHAAAVCRRISRRLADAGAVIISGLAIGIDAAAHEGALEGTGGSTIAVLGSGIDVVYPNQNRGLAARILEKGGAVVSEYPIGTAPKPENFPGRNRVISGLSRGVLVVEAGSKSGALITADFANDQGRTVFAMPGRVGDLRAAGTLGLLKQGAALATEAQDILSEFGWETSGGADDEHAAALSGDQAQLVEAIAHIGSPLLDDLIAKTGRPAMELLPMLTLLELRGVVKRVPGGRYISLHGC